MQQNNEKGISCNVNYVFNHTKRMRHNVFAQASEKKNRMLLRKGRHRQKMNE